MNPLAPFPARLAGFLAFVAIIIAVLVSGSLHGDFRIDESHKIAETAFFRALLRGDVRNPGWYAHIADRTNAPVGKYIYGAAILLTGGTLPELPTLAGRGHVEAIHPPELSAPYSPYLVTVRSVSMIAVALTAALLTTILCRFHGWVSAAAALAFYALTSLTQDYWATAVFDPLLALWFLVIIALVSAMPNAQSTKRIAAIAAGIGFFAALAFQTRLNGLFAFMIAVPFLAFILRRSPKKAILAIGIATCVLIPTTLTLNPLYWSSPRAPLASFPQQDGWFRPLDRLIQQKRDLETVATPLWESRTEARTVPEKFKYLCEIVMSSLAGLLLILSAVIGTVLLIARWRAIAPPLRIALLMSLTVVIVMVATLPMSWTRYLLVDIAPLALLGGFAIGDILRMLVTNYAPRPAR
ncbi:MAG TPA: hypothetical protein VGQ76_19255 [Thermoanaerobaculia bacterium]|nr:hypothetical protein [Thermoanaerobaculia bacterium]